MTRRCQDCATTIKGSWLPSLCLKCWDKLADWERAAITKALRDPFTKAGAAADTRHASTQAAHLFFPGGAL